MFFKSFLDFPLFLIKESQGSLLFLIRIVQFSRCCYRSSETALTLYHFLSGLSSTFFDFFQNLFLDSLTFVRSFQDSFNIISQIISFVNTFSEIFCFLFSSPLSFRTLPMLRQQSYFSVSPLRRLVYYSRFYLKCQHVNCDKLDCCFKANCV